MIFKTVLKPPPKSGSLTVRHLEGQFFSSGPWPTQSDQPDSLLSPRHKPNKVYF